MISEVVLFLFLVSMGAFLYFCIKPYLGFYRKFVEEEDLPDEHKILLNQNPRYRFLQAVYKEEALKLKAMKGDELNAFWGGQKKILIRRTVQGKNVKIELINNLEKNEPHVKVSVMPDNILGPLFAVSGSWKPQSEEAKS